MAKPKSIRNRWKQRERTVAKILGGRRNPLSGGSNITDQGQKRVGDVVGLDQWLVEVKDTSSKDAVYSFYQSVKNTGQPPLTMIHSIREYTYPEEGPTIAKSKEPMIIMNVDQFLDMWNNNIGPWFFLTVVKHFYYTKQFPFGAWWDKLEKDWLDGKRSGAVKETQLPLLIVHPKGKREQLAIIRLNDLLGRLVKK